jgi:glutamate carboxypeptidase
VTGFVERLAALCAVDSPTGYRPGVDACCRLVADWCQDAGANVEVVDAPTGLHLVASTRGRGHARTILIGHHDTVFARGTAAARPVTQTATRASGPGVADMKGGVLVALAALERLATDPAGRHGLVELHLVPDEEGRTTAPFVLDRWRGATAALCFECGRADGSIVTRRKAGTWVTITATGRAAHAGTDPDQGRSALMALIAETQRIRGLVDHARPGMTANATMLHAGEQTNTIPAAAAMVIDVRAATTPDLDWAFGVIHAFGSYDGVTLRASDDRGFPAMQRADTLADETLAILATLGQPATEQTAGGVSDASWASSVGVPAVDGLGPVGALDHTDEEYIELASVAPRIDATVRLVGTLA